MEERVEDYIKRIESIIATLSDHIEFEDYDEDVLKEASEDKEALENLLKRYKELEEENKKLKESETYLYDAYQDAGKKMFEYAEELEKSIPISVIQNKKKELVEVQDMLVSNKKELQYAIDILQELLQESEK